MVDPKALMNAIENLQGSGSFDDFANGILSEQLGWPIEYDGKSSLDRLTYDWTDDLQRLGLKKSDGPTELRQLRPFPDNPELGIFLVTFGSDRAFTTGRGMTTPLRRILRELVPKQRSSSTNPTWDKNQLLFICQHGSKHFLFARFREPPEGSKLSTMHVFGWGPGDSLRTVSTHNLQFLEYSTLCADGADKAFDVKRVGHLFYADYKRMFLIAKTLINHKGLSDDELHEATQLLFSRFLLLRFIEKMGWLEFTDSQGGYLRALTRAGGIEGESLYRSRFLPLFFEGLSSLDRRFDSDAFGSCPGLGGGLFKRNESLDGRTVDIPDSVIQKLVLYSHNFTVTESTPLDVEVAVDPEMVGRMFEELVTGRHDQGAFYTPRKVVSYMCKESIRRYLNHYGCASPDEIDQLIDSRSRPDGPDSIYDALKEIKVIDPACGSGAYLVGFILELLAIHETLYPDRTATEAYEAKKHFISRCVFGVDLDGYAVQIARFRLWLSLLVQAVDPEPMPNVDLNFVQGDSISGPDPRRYMWPNEEEAARNIGELRSSCVFQWGSEEEDSRKELSQMMEQLESNLTRDYPGEAVKFEIQFAEVFVGERGGFDVVLANPPYVRQERIDDDTKALVKKTRVYGEAITGKSDLYAYFYVRATQLLKDGGTSCFICSNTWMDVKFGFLLQRHFLDSFTDILVIDSRRERQFASAEINTVISIMDKGVSEDGSQIRFMMLEQEFEESLSDEKFRTEIPIAKERLIEIGSEGDEYIGSKWSLMLKAPQLYHNLMERHEGELRKVSQICRRTQRNNMRVLPEGYEVLRESAGTHADRRPFLHSFKDVSGIRLDLSEQKSVSHARVGIAMADGMVSGRFRRADIISNRFYGARIFFIEGGDFFVNDSFFIGQLQDGISVRNTILALNSTLSLLFVELRGRKGQGGGVLTFYGPEFTGHQVIDPSLLDSIEDSVYESLVTRDILEVYEECGIDKSRPIREQDPNPLPDRMAVDEYVFDILGLDEDDRKEVYWSLCESVLNRGTKAKSV